jgi:hypothetical protein
LFPPLEGLSVPFPKFQTIELKNPVSYSVPTFAADGRRLRNRTPESIEHLLALSLVVVERGRKDRIRAAFFRPTDGATPVKPRAHMGTKYSYNEHLPSGHTAWKHRRLLQSQQLEELLGIPQASDEDLDRFLQSVFRAVQLSCMVSCFDQKPEMTPASEQRKAKSNLVAISSAKKKNNVVSITSSKSAGAKVHVLPARPLEFDSQLRAA